MINMLKGGLSHLLYQHAQKSNNVKREKQGTTKEKRKNMQGRKNQEEKGN